MRRWRPSLLRPASLVLVLAYMLSTWANLPPWQSNTALFSRAVQLNPESPKYVHNLGFALQEAGRVEEARAAYQHALVLRPTYVPSLHAEAWFLEGEGDLDAARGLLRLAHQEAPQHVRIAADLGWMCLQLGALDEARQAVEAAIGQAEEQAARSGSPPDAGLYGLRQEVLRRIAAAQEASPVAE